MDDQRIDNERIDIMRKIQKNQENQSKNYKENDESKENKELKKYHEQSLISTANESFDDHD